MNNKTSRVSATFLGPVHLCNVCSDLKQMELMIIEGNVTTLNASVNLSRGDLVKLLNDQCSAANY